LRKFWNYKNKNNEKKKISKWDTPISADQTKWCREKNKYIHFGEEALGKAYLKIVYCLCGGEDNPTVGYENGGIFVNNLYKIII